jgi:hypothetical protein
MSECMTPTCRVVLRINDVICIVFGTYGVIVVGIPSPRKEQFGWSWASGLFWQTYDWTQVHFSFSTVLAKYWLCRDILLMKHNGSLLKEKKSLVSFELGKTRFLKQNIRIFGWGWKLKCFLDKDSLKCPRTCVYRAAQRAMFHPRLASILLDEMKSWPQSTRPFQSHGHLCQVELTDRETLAPRGLELTTYPALCCPCWQKATAAQQGW